MGRRSRAPKSERLPYIGLRGVSHTRISLFDASIRARRALVQAEQTGESSEEPQEVILKHLTSFADCVATMAQKGMLHIDLDAHNMQTTTPSTSSAACTTVTSLPPSSVANVRLDASLCQATMTSLVVMSVTEHDTNHELVEYSELAGMLATDWPDFDALAPGFVAAIKSEWACRYSTSPILDTPEGHAAHAISQRLHSRACAARGVAKETAGEEQFAHALDFVKSTLRVIADDVVALPTPLAS